MRSLTPACTFMMTSSNDCLVKPKRFVLGAEYAIDHAAVEINVAIQRRTKPMNKTHCSQHGRAHPCCTIESVLLSDPFAVMKPQLVPSSILCPPSVIAVPWCSNCHPMGYSRMRCRITCRLATDILAAHCMAVVTNPILKEDFGLLPFLVPVIGLIVILSSVHPRSI